MPIVQRKLQSGVRVADVGCGRGRGLIKLAQAFTACIYFGYDLYGPAVDEATARAKAAGVHDRVTFQQVDVSNGLPGEYDVITTFAWGGAGLGTVGFHEKKVHELCAEAGFRSIRRVPIENPFSNLYEITP